MTEAELKTALKHPDWRLRNLYWVLDKDGHEVLFKPWPMQERFLHEDSPVVGPTEVILHIEPPRVIYVTPPPLPDRNPRK